MLSSDACTLAMGFLSPPFLFFLFIFFFSFFWLPFAGYYSSVLFIGIVHDIVHMLKKKKKKLYFYLFLFFLTINPTFSLLNPDSPSKMIPTSKSTNHPKPKPTIKKKFSNLSYVTWLLKPNLDTKILWFYNLVELK